MPGAWRGLLSDSFRCAGRRASLLLLFGAVAGQGLAFVELVFAGLLQMFLRAVGVAPAGAETFGIPAHLVLPPAALASLLLVVGLFRAFGNALVGHGAWSAAKFIEARLRLLALHEMLGRASGVFVPSSLTNLRFAEIFPRAAYAFQCVALLLPVIGECAVLLVLLFMAAWREALVGVGGLLFMGIAALVLNRGRFAEAEDIPREEAGLMAGVERVARNWLLVRVLRTAEAERRALSAHVIEATTRRVRVGGLAGLLGGAPQAAGVALMALLVFLNLGFWRTPGLRFIAFLYLFMRFAQAVSGVAQSVGELSGSFPQLRMAIEFFRGFSPSERREAMAPADGIPLLAARPRGAAPACFGDAPAAAPPGPGGPSPAAPPPGVVLENVSFAYRGGAGEVIRGLSLAIAAGTQFGIVGKSGAGKSTLLGLILGVVEPTAGRVTVGGLPAAAWFSQPGAAVGYVGAEPFLIAGTLRENLDYGARRTYAESEYAEALRAARLPEAFETLGLDYVLDEAGGGLSMGQRQRLALARALLARPLVLVLDEASANLDDETEAGIAETVLGLKGSATVIIASHRPGLLRHADAVLDLSGSVP